MRKATLSVAIQIVNYALSTIIIIVEGLADCLPLLILASCDLF